MPVENHAVHSKTKVAVDKPYGCHNRSMSEGYHAPNRAAGTDGYKPTWFFERIRIPHVMSRECRYDMSLSDLRCSDCKHRGSGERYAELVRSRS